MAWRSKFRERLEWIYANRPGLENRNRLSVRAGLARSTIGNGLNDAEGERREPDFDKATLEAIAGAAHVSFSWLSGHGKDPNADDIPPPPEEPLARATKRMKPADELKVMRAQLAELQRQISVLQQAKK